MKIYLLLKTLLPSLNKRCAATKLAINSWEICTAFDIMFKINKNGSQCLIYQENIVDFQKIPQKI